MKAKKKHQKEPEMKEINHCEEATKNIKRTDLKN